MKKLVKWSMLLMAAVMMMCAGKETEVCAMERIITLQDGDSGNEVSSYYNSWYDYDESNYFCIGDTGRLDAMYQGDTWYGYGPMTTKQYTVTNPAVVQVDAEGNYQVLAAGTTDVTMTGFNAEGKQVFQASYTFYVCGDVTAMTLDKSSVDVYLFLGGSSWWTYYSGDSVYVNLVNAPDMTYHTFDYVVADSSMGVECSLDTEKKVLEISASGEGTTMLTVTINGKAFTIQVKATKVSINKSSSVLAKKKNTTLKLKGYRGKVTWKSTNSKVVSVNGSGKVKAKKVGNAVVYAMVGDHKIGCAVSAVTPKMKKVINKAKKIARTCTYSQAQRMSSKYYDCSSLVWKSYKKAGKNFGNNSYAPVAADIGKWCASHKKIIKGGCSEKNISNMKLRPGDLLFKTGEKNGRYKGIYHVEMFVGYQCDGFNGDTPILGTLWAARTENYGGSGFMMARP